MPRQTSIATYHQIEQEGLLSKRRLEVYQILFKYGPLTAHEIVDVARTKYPKANQTGFNARLSELKTLGVVSEVGAKKHEVSGKQNILWDVTSELPKKTEPDSNLSNKKKLQLAIQELKSFTNWAMPPMVQKAAERALERIA